MLRLRNKLLSFGGEEACLPCIEEDFEEIMKYGQLWYGGSVLLKKGAASQCHRNSAYLWDANQGQLLIATGYALSEDGMWRQHTWCIWPRPRGTKVVETTVKRIAYFGFVMPYERCVKFYYENE